MIRRAIVLGGGVAGIAAAFALRDLGLETELWESRGWLGGRAFSLPQKKGGIARRIDNGPHVMLGCYDHMRGLLRRIGSEGSFDRPRALDLVYAASDGRRGRLSLLPFLPAPIALPLAILTMRGPAFGTRLRGLGGMLRAPFGARRRRNAGRLARPTSAAG